MQRVLLAFLFWFWSTSLLAVAPVLIPRTPTPIYRSDVFFEGGSDLPASLQSLRMADHGTFERWVLDFGNEKGGDKQKIAPKFQIRFLPAQKVESDTGELLIAKPAKLIVTLHKVKKNLLEKTVLAKLVERSNHIQKITVYPPIEDGDTAMEFTLSSETPVNIHQPLENEGRLVIDLAPSSKK